MAPYSELYPVGTRVRVRSKATLEAFRVEWRLHHPLSDEQLGFAEREAVVKSVGFYHGGDPLYVLDNVPGIWHEVCLLGFEVRAV
jgi:hypothetical protein